MKKFIVLIILLLPISILEAQPVSFAVVLETIQITEIYPAPIAPELEWIEIYNYGDQEVNLNNYYFLDRGTNGAEFGKTKSFTGNIKIKPKEYLVFENLKISLNNSGDTITLFNNSDKVIDSVFYPTANSTESFGRKFEVNKYFPEYKNTSVELLPTSGVTKNTQNYFVELLLSSILDTKKAIDGTEVLVRGTVTVDIGSFGDGIFYIQDNSSGIRVELLEDSGAEINENQLITIRGIKTKKNNEMQITVENLKDIIFEETGKFEFYTGMDAVDINVGNIYQIDAVVSKQSSNGFYIYNQGGELKVTISEALGIDDSKLSKNDKIKLTGILSKFNSSFRLLPRKQEDIQLLSISEVIEAEEIETTASSVPKVTQISEFKIPSIDIISNGSYKVTRKIYIWPLVLINLILLLLIISLYYRGQISLYLKRFNSILYNPKEQESNNTERYKIILEDDQTV